MTRKDYQLIANAIAGVKDSAKWAVTGKNQEVALDAIEALEARLASELAKENPAFDIDKFLDACR